MFDATDYCSVCFLDLGCFCSSFEEGSSGKYSGPFWPQPLISRELDKIIDAKTISSLFNRTFSCPAKYLEVILRTIITAIYVKWITDCSDPRVLLPNDVVGRFFGPTGKKVCLVVFSEIRPNL